MKYKSIIFDWDGTLGMTLHLWLEAYKNELEKLGHDLSDEVIGDSPHDIVAAKAAKLYSCLFLPEENKMFYDFNKLKKLDPTYDVESLKDFTNLIINT